MGALETANTSSGEKSAMSPVPHIAVTMATLELRLLLKVNIRNNAYLHISVG